MDVEDVPQHVFFSQFAKAIPSGSTNDTTPTPSPTSTLATFPLSEVSAIRQSFGEWSARNTSRGRHLSQLSEMSLLTNTSFATNTSSSTVPGIGMVSGRLIKALGVRTLSATENLSIRLRLTTIRASLQNPMRDPEYLVGASQAKSEYEKRKEKVLGVIEDLRELITYSDYPVDIRKSALALKSEISSKLSAIQARRRAPDDGQLKPTILLLGATNSGKTIFLKNLITLFPGQSSRSSSDAVQFIWDFILIGLSKLAPLTPGNLEVLPHRHPFTPRSMTTLNQWALWIQSEQVPLPMEYSYMYHYLSDDFLRRAFTIGYVPSKKDVLLLPTLAYKTGVHSTSLSQFTVIDTCGQLSERDQWETVYDKTSVVVFCVSIPMKRFPNDVLPIHASLAIWRAVTRAAGLRKVDWVLLFTKADVLHKNYSRNERLGSTLIKDASDSFSEEIGDLQEPYLRIWNENNTDFGLQRTLHIHVLDQLEESGTSIKEVLKTLEVRISQPPPHLRLTPYSVVYAPGPIEQELQKFVDEASPAL